MDAYKISSELLPFTLYTIWIYLASFTVAGSTIDLQDGFPEEMHISVGMGESSVLLRLRRNANVDANVPLFVICNGSIFQKNTTGDMAIEYYQDIETGSSIEVSCQNNASIACEPALRGSFFQDGMLYDLSPITENDTLPVSHLRKRSLGHHIVLKKTDEYGNEVASAPEIVSLTIDSNPPGERRRRAIKSTHCVELVIVCSYDVFEKWVNLSPKGPRLNREDNAIFNMRRYFALVAQGADLRYSSITTAEFSLCVRLSAFVIATTRGDSPWTENLKTGSSVDGAKVLPSFRVWSIRNGGKVGQYDHIQLITGYDVKTRGDATAVGLSYINSICLQSWAVSIVEDSRDIMHTITASAHEIGHSLGAYHDGHRNTCPKSSKYVMSPQIGKPTEANSRNPWKFSQCSIQYFGKMLKLLKRYNIDCMSDKPQILDAGQWELYTRQLPGQIYSPDQQCQLMHGQASYMSRKILQSSTTADICTGIWCNTGGRKFTYHIPARGTPCGSKKWCIDGACLTNSSAPVLDESCPFGDHKSDIFIGWSCKKLVQLWDYLCVWNYQGMKKKCCESCKPVLATNRGKRSIRVPSINDIEAGLELHKRAFRSVSGPLHNVANVLGEDQILMSIVKRRHFVDQLLFSDTDKRERSAYEEETLSREEPLNNIIYHNDLPMEA